MARVLTPLINLAVFPAPPVNKVATSNPKLIPRFLISPQSSPSCFQSPANLVKDPTAPVAAPAICPYTGTKDVPTPSKSVTAPANCNFSASVNPPSVGLNTS